MLKYLKLRNVGPAASMALEFGERLNLITGDNGLGKSFLLDIAWWALTKKWPSEINVKLTAGKKALPSVQTQAAAIDFAIVAEHGEAETKCSFIAESQAWRLPNDAPTDLGLVLYAMTDGSFAVWDPARNYRPTQYAGPSMEIPMHPNAYVFSPSEVWEGLDGSNGKPLCNGLIRDWAIWQSLKGSAVKSLRAVLKELSPSASEPITLGEPVRISLDDARDMPTIRMPYGQDVPLVHASAGMRRILALAYLLVWSWEEHQKAAKLLNRPTTNHVVFLIDEVESHLHPQWQRKIVPALLAVVKKRLIKNAEVQIIAATHSPLVMVSVEPIFDAAKDAWFDLDLRQSEVVLTRRDYEKQGEAAA